MSMKHDHHDILRRIICGEHDTDSCDGCPLYDMDNCYEQTPEAEMAMLAFFGKHPAEDGEAEKEECRRSDSSAKSAKPYPQDAEEDEYRYIDADWLEAVARGLTAGAEKHPGETWRQIPPVETVKAAREAPCLILDDLGAERITEWVGEQLFCLLNYRYNSQLQTIITTNYSTTELAERLTIYNKQGQADDAQAQRILSRIYGMCERVYLGGKDWRQTGNAG